MRPFRATFRALFVVSLLWLAGCKKTDDPAQPAPNIEQYLADAQLIGKFTKAQLAQQLSGFGPLATLFLRQDVRAYKIVYKTKGVDGADLQASGLLVVPEGTAAYPIVSYQHGTMRTESEAPSYFNPQGEVTSTGPLFASQGFIISAPDYLGYGTSKQVEHPYEHRATLASASLDMLRATREFLARPQDRWPSGDVPIRWNNQLFLAGYSQGGFATMSLLKAMEDNVSHGFTITAASCGAGAYNKTGFMQDLGNKITHGIAEYNNLYYWVLRTYNRVYGLNRPMSAYLKEPYATDVQQNGLRANVPVSFNLTITDAFRNALNNNTDKPFLDAVSDNNVYDWRPRTPLQLYHGTADLQVFFRNSQDAYNAMRAKGATNVELIPVPDKDHGPAIQDYVLGTFAFFNSRKL